MVKYCPNCKKEYDFTVKSMKDMENLICPECGQRVPANSKKPPEGNPEQVAYGIGAVLQFFARLAWVFLAILAVIAILCFFMHWYTALYIITAVSLLYYVVRYGLVSELGFVWIPLAAGIGFYYMRTIEGICLFVNIAMIVRHIIRNLIWDLIFKLINMGR